MTYPSFAENGDSIIARIGDAEDLRIRRELGYRVDWPVYHSTINVLAKTLRICWKLVTGCYR
ncbi:MAG: hypothetical protein IH878_13290 [Gemmatimonadetes bacterium]|nr:hypothetical protein [Gemmatimonadota bacterium]